MRGLIALAIVVFLSVLVSSALAQEPVIYPGQGQTQEQMEQDKFACYNWAREQTGFDPLSAAQQPSQPPPASSESTSGGAKSGALKGGAVGAIGGAIGGSAGKGAAIGAGTGALLGGMKRRGEERSEAQAQQQQEEQQTAAIEQKRGDYNRAYKACLEGRGYTVR